MHEVAGEDRLGLAEARVDARPAAARRRAVHDVVVDEREVVEDLDRERGREGAAAGVRSAERLGREQERDGPDPLAARRERVADGVVEARRVGGEVERGEAGLDLGERVQRSCADVGEGGGDGRLDAVERLRPVDLDDADGRGERRLDRRRVGVVDGEARADRRLVVVGAVHEAVWGHRDRRRVKVEVVDRARLGVGPAAREARDDVVVGDAQAHDGVERGVVLVEVREQPLGLRDGPREAVEHEAVVVERGEVLGDERVGDVVGTRRPSRSRSAT